MNYHEENESEILERSRIEREQIVAKYDKGRDKGAVIDEWEDPKFEDYHKRDRFGFIHDQRLPDVGKRNEIEKKQLQVERNRSMKWVEMMKKSQHFFDPAAKHREKMINRIYKGVPDSVRGQLWAILLSVGQLREEQPKVYEKMKHIARLHSPDIRQIDLDVNRTYRDHDMFRDRYNSRQNALFHVLAAYSVYNTEVGYCQGMSQIAALLLMYLMEEEDAFWGLHQIMNNSKIAMHGFFIHGFPKLMRFQQHHDKVMRKFLPRLKKHLDKQGIDSGIYTLKWFFQCFLDRIPFSLTLRVWDLYLLEGERVMIAMAYTILWLHRRKLMKMQMDDGIEYLQILVAKDFGYDDDSVIERLRENMHDLRSHRLDHPGRPSEEELPKKPFGLFDLPEVNEPVKKPTEWTIEREAGLRTSFTEEEREFSQNAILRQQQANHTDTHEDIDEEDEEDLDDTGHGNSFDESSQMKPLRSTSTAGGGGVGGSLAPSGGGGESRNQEFDTSFDASNGGEAFDDDEDVVYTLQGGKSPLPPSKEQDVLDSSLRDMLKAASEISYDHLSTTSSDKLNKRPRSSHLMESSSVNHHETSFESYFGQSGVERSASNSDVVRIRVPYTREDALNTREGLHDRLHKANSHDIADSNKIRISVNHDQNGGGNGSGGSRADSTGNSSGDPGSIPDQSENRASLEESFNTKLVMSSSKKTKKNNHIIKSNSKSMTNL